MAKRLILICGESGTGKSASLHDMRDHPSVLYLNAESNKELPFPNKFKKAKIVDPLQVPGFFDKAEEMDTVKTIITDSITFLMDQYESQYVLGDENTMARWSDFQQYFKDLMQNRVANSTKYVVMLAHTQTVFNKDDQEMVTSVPVKGALKANGVEAYFSIVVATKKISIRDLEPYKNDMLTITDEEKVQGYKHVFQVKPTASTTKERIRTPMFMFDTAHTYIDNNTQKLLDFLDEFYDEG